MSTRRSACALVTVQQCSFDPRDVEQTKSKTRVLNFKEANFQLFRELIKKTPWETVLMGKGMQQRWQIVKEAFFKAQELSIHRCSTSGKEGKRPA